MQTESAEVLLARRLEQSISLAPVASASGTEAVTCGPFRAWFTSHTDKRQLNYAMPVIPTEPDTLGPAIENLRAVFATRRRTLRVEFVEELWPGLAATLQRSGLHLDAREPLMACMKRELVPVAAAGVTVRPLSADASDADLEAFVQIRDQHPVDGTRRASRRAIEALREALRAGSQSCAMATADDRPAGVGRCILQTEGLGEVTSIVTLPEFRRRGVAATLVSFLIRHLFETGGDVAWLNADNEQARSVYAGLGFRSIGSLLNYEDGADGERQARV